MRGLFDGEGAFSAEPGDEGRCRLPSISDGFCCIWPCFAWSMFIACGLLSGINNVRAQIQSQFRVNGKTHMFWLLAIAVRGRLFPGFMPSIAPFCIFRIIYCCCWKSGRIWRSMSCCCACRRRDCA